MTAQRTPFFLSMTQWQIASFLTQFVVATNLTAKQAFRSQCSHLLQQNFNEQWTAPSLHVARFCDWTKTISSVAVAWGAYRPNINRNIPSPSLDVDSKFNVLTVTERSKTWRRHWPNLNSDMCCAACCHAKQSIRLPTIWTKVKTLYIFSLCLVDHASFYNPVNKTTWCTVVLSIFIFINLYTDGLGMWRVWVRRGGCIGSWWGNRS